MWKVLIATIIAGALVLYVTNNKCTIKCGSSTKENMTAGLGTINGLALYNNARVCYGGNADGSTDPFCTTSGYVLT